MIMCLYHCQRYRNLKNDAVPQGQSCKNVRLYIHLYSQEKQLVNFLLMLLQNEFTKLQSAHMKV